MLIFFWSLEKLNLQNVTWEMVPAFMYVWCYDFLKFYLCYKLAILNYRFFDKLSVNKCLKM